MNEHRNEQLIHAVSGCRDPHQLSVSAHEIGHAIAALEAGDQPEWVRLNFGLLGGFAGGLCWFGEAPDPAAPADQLTLRVGAWIAGHAAEVRFCQLYLGMDEPAAWKFGRDWADGDYDTFAYYRSKLRLRTSVDAAFAHATRLFDRYGAHLDRLTLRLYHARYLTGAALGTPATLTAAKAA